MTGRRVGRRGGFTLIELMVAIAIIALLVGILIPTFAGVSIRAKTVATQGTFSALDKGLESYNSERALGGTYPPSIADWALNPLQINNPLTGLDGGVVASITGANLLVYGLTGPDQLGTAGFRDLKERTGTRPGWYDDIGAQQGMAYELDETTKDTMKPRYPGSGATYVDNTTRAGIRSLRQLFQDGLMVDDPAGLPSAAGVPDQPFFTDGWGLPILYYRANRAGSVMVNNPGTAVGVYDVRDNAFLTGCQVNPAQRAGIDFGAGPNVQNSGHPSRIARTEFPGVDPELDVGVHAILVEDNFKNTFERFILDPAIKVRNRPVNADKYLLISAGDDAIYGTSDDVVNWERER